MIAASWQQAMFVFSGKEVIVRSWVEEMARDCSALESCIEDLPSASWQMSTLPLMNREDSFELVHFSMSLAQHNLSYHNFQETLFKRECSHLWRYFHRQKDPSWGPISNSGFSLSYDSMVITGKYRSSSLCFQRNWPLKCYNSWDSTSFCSRPREWANH